MYNWSVDEEYLKKFPKKYKIWRIKQLINYGLKEGERLDKKEIKLIWPEIKDDLDLDAKKMIEFYIWGKPWKKERGLRPDRKNFWSWYFKRRISSKNFT